MKQDTFRETFDKFGANTTEHLIEIHSNITGALSYHHNNVTAVLHNNEASTTVDLNDIRRLIQGT